MARTPLWYGQASSSHSRIGADFPVCPLLCVNSRQLDSSQGLGDLEVLQLLLGVHEFLGTLSALDRAIPEQRLYKQPVEMKQCSPFRSSSAGLTQGETFLMSWAEQRKKSSKDARAAFPILQKVHTHKRKSTKRTFDGAGSLQ